MLFVGDLAIEVLMKLKRMPSPGDVLDEDAYLFLPGGPAGNAALAASYFGVDAALCSRVGKDGNALRLTRFFEANHVNIDCVFTEAASQTGMTVSFTEDAYAEGRTVRYRAASAKLSASDLEAALKTRPDGVFLSCEVDGYIATAAAAGCEALGIPLYLDASEERLLRALSVKGARVKMLYTTDRAAESLTEMTARDVGSALKCCLTLGQRIVADVYVIRMRNRGLFLYDGRTYNIVMATDANEVAPKIGFADVESAVLASVYHRQGDPYNACGIAVIADILAREATGFRIPTSSHVAAYIRKYGLNYKI